jgi:hypothetical protein
MAETLALDRMTVRQKLAAMEALWTDLTNPPEKFRSPAWHEKVLDRRRARVASGKAKFVDWETAKQQILKRVK